MTSEKTHLYEKRAKCGAIHVRTVEQVPADGGYKGPDVLAAEYLNENGDLKDGDQLVALVAEGEPHPVVYVFGVKRQAVRLLREFEH